MANLGTVPASTSLALSDLTADQAWQTVTLQNGWVQYSDTVNYHFVGIYKDSEGMIHLRGLISNPTANGWTVFNDTLLFNMPAVGGFTSLGGFNFAPAWNGRTTAGTTNVIIKVISNSVYVRINNNLPPACTWLSLDGISFPASDADSATRKVAFGTTKANATQTPNRSWTKVADYTASLPASWGLSSSELYVDGEGFCYCIYHIYNSPDAAYANGTFMVVPEAYRPAGNQIFGIVRSIDGDQNTYDGEFFRADLLTTGVLKFVNPTNNLGTTRFDGIIGWAPAAYDAVNFPNSLFFTNAGDPFPKAGAVPANALIPNAYGNTLQPSAVVPTFANGWANYATASYDVARIFKSTLKNNIRMQGLIKPGTANSVAMNAPVAIDSGKWHVFLTLYGAANGSGNGVPGEIRMNPFGQVQPIPANTWHTLCGINYSLTL